MDEAKQISIDVAYNLRRLRITHGRTQKEAAQLLHVPLSTYRKWESGKVRFNLQHVFIFARFYHVPLFELFLS